MEAVRCHPAPIETSRQFSREQNVGQLGFAVAANLGTEAWDERSAMKVATVAPFPTAALMRADAMRVLVWLRPTMARFAPSAASASAAANPMPLVAPVIRICLSFTAQQSKALATRG